MKLTVALRNVLTFVAVMVLSVHAGNERQRGPGFVAGRRSGPSLSLVPGVNQRMAKSEFSRAFTARSGANPVNAGWVYSPTARHGAAQRWASTPTLQIAASAPTRVSPDATQPATAADENIRFVTMNVFIDTRVSALAAYQFEFSAVDGHVEIVGIESGAHPAFAAKPPYYDPAALHHEHRVLIAAYSTADDLPKGKTRVARLHLAVYGDAKPHYQAVIQAAASPTGKSIIEEATISVSEGAP